MKTHDFAKQLNIMAKILKSGPNIELEDLTSNSLMFPASATVKIQNDEIPHALNILVGLNQVSKQQWLDLIEEFGFRIPIRVRDANRDILGKLLNYLKNNPIERERLVGKKSRKNISSSTELADALSILLK